MGKITIVGVFITFCICLNVANSLTKENYLQAGGLVILAIAVLTLSQLAEKYDQENNNNNNRL